MSPRKCSTQRPAPTRRRRPSGAPPTARRRYRHACVLMEFRDVAPSFPLRILAMTFDLNGKVAKGVTGIMCWSRTPRENMKIAAVTGAASGIGQRTVERLLEAGWVVWAMDSSHDAMAAQARTLNVGERLRFLECDVTNAASTCTAFETVAKQTERIDALVCSAGILRVGSMEEASESDVDLMLQVNVKGPWLSVRAALALLRSGASTANPSRVVIVGSIGGIRPKAGAGFYGASKAAVHVIAGVMAVELAPSGVTVNVVAPGTVNTPMVDAAVRSSGYKPSGDSPLGRVAQPDDVVDVIEFFLSDSARYVNGVVLPADGGTRAAYSSK